MRPTHKTLFFLIIFLFPCGVIVQAKVVYPQPTLVLPDNTTVYVTFRFGAWNRIASNNSKITVPVIVYVYSRNMPVEVHDNYNATWKGFWGLALNRTSLNLTKPYVISIKYGAKAYKLVFTPVRELKEQAGKPKATVPLDKFREFLDKEAQYAAGLAAFAIVLALGVKRKTLLMRVFNSINLGILTFFGGAIYYLAPRAGHSRWLSLPFILSYILAYAVIPVGRKMYLIKIIPSLRKIIWEQAIIYRTAEGLLAYARQTTGEAIKRLFGKHIIVKDAEVNKLGELPNDKVWTVEDVETLEKSEGLLVLDAKLTRERILEEGGEGGIYE